MPKIIDKAVITETQKDELESAWYAYSAFSELIKSGTTEELILNRYEITFKKYNQVWGRLLKEYFEEDYSIGKYNWNCDFETCTISITL